MPEPERTLEKIAEEWSEERARAVYADALARIAALEKENAELKEHKNELVSVCGSLLYRVQSKEGTGHDKDIHDDLRWKAIKLIEKVTGVEHIPKCICCGFRPIGDRLGYRCKRCAIY